MKTFDRASVLIPSLLLAAALLGGCENSAGTESLDTYVETLLVQGYVDADRPIRVQVTRTIPPLERWSIERAEITDAEVTIIVDGTAHRLPYIGKAIYADSGLSAISGKTYRIVVRWDEREATASTLVPGPVALSALRQALIPAFDFCFEGATTASLQAEIVPAPNTVFRSSIDLRTSRRAFSYGPVISRAADTNERGEFLLTLGEYCIDTPVETGADTFEIELYIYDAPFFDFFATYRNGNNRDEVLETAGTEVTWNIEGDGIGIFIGRTVVRDTVVM